MKVDPVAVSAAALDALVEPVLMTDVEGRLTFVNATAARVFGAEKHLGRPVADLLARFPTTTTDGAVLTPSLHPIVRALAQHQAVIGAELQMDLAGRTVTYLVNTVPLRDSEGSGIVAVFHDVSEARRLEREAAEHAARLEALVDVVNEGVYIVSAEGRLVFINALGREQIGDPAIVAMSPVGRAQALRFTDLDGRPLAPESLPSSRALRGETVAGLEVLVHHADGDIRHMRMNAHPLRRQGEPIYAAVVTWKDVTEEYRALADVETARRAAEEANRLKDEFIAALSHELRTPLQPILGWTEVLRRHPGIDEVTARALEAIHRNVRHQVRLVDDLLDLSRIVHGKLALRCEPFDLREQVRVAVESFEESASLKRVRLTAALPAGPVPMWGDGARVHQVVSNLISNALKFTPPGGHVEARLEVRQHMALIEVADTGEGIASSDLAIIWEPFRQGRLAPRRGGLGIGLDLVRRLTELHGGRVAVTSDGPGRGARFRIELPLSAPSAPAAGAASGTSRRLEGRAMLVIEDNADTRDVLKLMLELEGADVQAVETGEAGMSVAERRRLDAVLCDIGLPDIDGMEVARRLRAQSHLGDVRLIALTGYGQAEDVRQALDAGFDAHLTKPINIDQLVVLLAGGGRAVDTVQGLRVE
jgi:signal transduction histidine kinase/ActR/RegA family two-component response regulator